MKKPLLVLSLLLINVSAWACEKNTLFDWASTSSSDTCNAYTSGNTQVNITIDVSSQDAFGNKLNNIEVVCNNTTVAVPAGSFYICSTSETVTWYDQSSSAPASGYIGVSKVMSKGK